MTSTQQTFFSERIGIASILLLFAFSFFGWYVLFHGTLSGIGSVALSFLLGFSFACISFFLGVLLWHERYERILGATVPFLPALIFAQEVSLVLAIAGSILLTLLAIYAIRKEEKERIHFQYFRINQAGQFYFILALALSISVAYFGLIREASWEELVPKLRLGEGSAVVLLKAVSMKQPILSAVKTDEVTVDEYLLSLTEEKKAETVNTEESLFSLEVTLAPGIEESLKKSGLTFTDVRNSETAKAYYLNNGHAHFARLVDGEIRGDEPMNAVISQILQRKIITTLDGTDQVKRVSPDVIPTAIAVVLFLALIPLGTLLAYVWLLFGYGVFLYLLKTKQIEIREHLDEVEELRVV
jgi:hypothetical protein